MGSQSDDQSSILSIKDNANKVLWRCQYTLALMGFIGFSIVYAMRVNLSVAIVAMVGKNETFSNGTSNDDLACPIPEGSDQEGVVQEGEFDWDATEQGLVLSSFYWGYALTNIIGGMAAERYGGRIVMGSGVLACSILTFLSPLAARASSGLFIAFRVLEGFTEGVSFPAMNAILVSWVLPEERSRFSGLIYAGVHFGTVVTLSVSGIMCSSDFLGGWPSVFYVFGGMGIIWSVFWFILIRDTPAQHPRISDWERKRLHPITLIKSEGNKTIPWKHILTSKPIWGVAIMHFGYNWGFYTLLTELPTYFDQIQHLDISSNGLLSALPYLITWIVSLIFTNLVTKFTAEDKISILNVRRLAMTLSGYVPMLALIGMCFVGCDQTLAIVVLCISVGICGVSFAGYMCSHMDLAPRFAGTLFGLTNTLGTIPGFVSPIITGLITEDNETLSAWRTVFLISSLFYALSTTFYLVVIRADVQHWNYIGVETTEEKTKQKEEKF